MEEKKRSNSLILILLVIIIIGLSGYIVYDKVLSDRNEKNNNVEEEISNEITNLSEKEVQEIYSNIFGFKANGINNIVIGDGYSYDYSLARYQKNKIVAEVDFDYSTRMTIAYEKLVKENKTTRTEGGSTPEIVWTEKFLVSDIKDAYEFYFGKSNDFKAEEFSDYAAGNCKISIEDSSEYYICESYAGGGISGPLGMLTTYDKYESDEDKLYIYEKVLFYNGVDGTFYNSSDFSDEITELREKDINVISDENYSDKVLKYKHTFKQNSDGSYYWYSTEPINM